MFVEHPVGSEVVDGQAHVGAFGQMMTDEGVETGGQQTVTRGLGRQRKMPQQTYTQSQKDFFHFRFSFSFFFSLPLV